MAWNKSGIKNITINFDLKRLEDVLEKNPDFLLTENVKSELYENIAHIAINNIRSSNFDDASLQDSTIAIRKWRGNPSGPPLIETGKLLNSIKAVKGGIEMEEYGQYHLRKNGYKIVKNEFSKKFNTVGKHVPQRNFLQTKTTLTKQDKFKPSTLREMYDKLNKLIRTTTKSMGR